MFHNPTTLVIYFSHTSRLAPKKPAPGCVRKRLPSPWVSWIGEPQRMTARWGNPKGSLKGISMRKSMG